jgi:hypothetical protein
MSGHKCDKKCKPICIATCNHCLHYSEEYETQRYIMKDQICCWCGSVRCAVSVRPLDVHGTFLTEEGIKRNPNAS